MKHIFLLLLLFSGMVCAADQSKILRAHFRDRPPDMTWYCDNRFDGPLKVVLEEAAERIGYKIVWKRETLQQSMKDIVDGKVDIIPYVFQKTAAREKAGIFSVSMGIRNKTVEFVVRPGKEGSIKVFDDLIGKDVGIINSAAYFDEFTNNPNIRKVEFQNEVKLAQNFAKSKIDIIAVIDKESMRRTFLSMGFTRYAYAQYVKNLRFDQHFLYSHKFPDKSVFQRLDAAIEDMRKKSVIMEIFESFNSDLPYKE